MTKPTWSLRWALQKRALRRPQSLQTTHTQNRQQTIRIFASFYQFLDLRWFDQFIEQQLTYKVPIIMENVWLLYCWVGNLVLSQKFGNFSRANVTISRLLCSNSQYSPVKIGWMGDFPVQSKNGQALLQTTHTQNRQQTTRIFASFYQSFDLRWFALFAALKLTGVDVNFHPHRPEIFTG